MADSTSTQTSTQPVTPAATDPSSPDPNASNGTKWWGQSITVWGTIITTVATVIPVVGPLIGLNIPPEMVQVFGTQAIGAAQAIGGLVGTAMTIYGRARATQPLHA